MRNFLTGFLVKNILAAKKNDNNKSEDERKTSVLRGKFGKTERTLRSSSRGKVCKNRYFA